MEDLGAGCDRVSDWRWASAWALKKKREKKEKGEKRKGREGKKGKEGREEKRREEERRKKEKKKEKKKKGPQSVVHTSAFSCCPVLSLSPRGTLGR